MRGFSRALAVPALVGLVFFGMGSLGCAPVTSLEPTDTKKDRVLDPALLGVWSVAGFTHFRVTLAHGRYRVIGVWGSFKDERSIRIFDGSLIKLNGHLFLVPYLDPNAPPYWYTHSLALVKQLHPAPVIVFIDPNYLQEHPPPIPLATGPTKEVQHFLLSAIERGAFDKDDWTTKWFTSKATVLHFAAAQGHSKEIKKLVSDDANLDAPDEQGRTPLHWAGEFDQEKVFAQLTAAGADVNVADNYGITPLHMAAWFEDANVVKTLLAKGADVDARMENGKTPLHEGAWSGSVRIVELLLAEGANVNAKDTAGWTPLHDAHVVDIVELLLANGADVNAKSEDKRTPLHLRARTGSVEAVELLLNQGADVNAKAKEGWTPLHAGTWSGSADVVELLLARGADVNATASHWWTPASGWTPLHDAAKSGSIAIVELLIANGADVDARTKEGMRPIEYAMDPNVIELLKQHTH